jgi:hypothetical protein
MKAVVLASVAVLGLSGCGNDASPPAAAAPAGQAGQAAPLVQQGPSTKALPFHVEGSSLSDLFKNNLKVSIIEVGVDGGTPPEWSATAVAIAEKVATFGADSVEVSVRRNEIVERQGVRFREVAHAYYSPNPAHTVWDDPGSAGKRWQVLQVDAAHLATQRDVEITDAYDALNQQLIDKGVDADAADRKAGAAIAKKYHLPADWHLPVGNTLSEIPRNSLNVDAGDAAGGLAVLDRCLNGKIVRMVTTCAGGE